MLARAAVICCCLFAAGCASFQGGMPNLPFNLDEELGYAKENLKRQASVETYYKSPSAETRNEYLSTRVVIINIEYLKYIKTLSAEESQIHSATDILQLTLELAAAGFNPAATKTVLTSLAALTGGVRLSIDKNAYFQKTMSALISAMNAQRKEVLLRIIKGSSTNLAGYPFHQAMSDINDYYLAGTIPGALSSIQKDSGTKEDNANRKINLINITRSAAFLDPSRQARIDSLLSEVDKLPAEALFALNGAPPERNDNADRAVAGVDIQNTRQRDKAMAARMLKMRIALAPRDDEDALASWEAAVKSFAK
jgi:hypothetical protein